MGVIYKTRGRAKEYCDIACNAYTTCSHSCKYCLPAGTKIMMGNYIQKPIEEIKIGDEIIGIKKSDINNGRKYYKFLRAKVVNTSKRLAETLKFETTNGNLICTPEHPLMGSTIRRYGIDWRPAGMFSPYENIRFVHCGDINNYSIEQRLGYIKGIRDGDGCVFKHINKQGREYFGFELVGINKELENKIREDFREILNIELKVGMKRASKNSFGSDVPMLHTRISKDVEELEKKTKFRLNIEFAKGYIAGMLDTDGSVGVMHKTMRIHQSKIANKTKYENLLGCCNLLNLKYVEEKDGIYIHSDFRTRIRFLFEFGISHSVKRDRLLLGSSIKGSVRSIIRSISIHKKEIVYNLQTECENFIANGFIVHNCYVPQILHKSKEDFHNLVQYKKNIIERIAKEASQYEDKLVLLSFATDPYQPIEKKFHITHDILEIFIENGVIPMILTKGYMVERDLELIKKANGWLGMTLTLMDGRQNLYWEPHATKPAQRLALLSRAHDMGIKTWVSFEPIIYPEQTIELLKLCHSYVDLFKVGKMNYYKTHIDWTKTLRDILFWLKKYECDYYIKNSLMEYWNGEK